MSKTPDWYKEENLTKIRYTKGETGWAVDMLDGTYRLANMPIAAMRGDYDSPRWGDLVRVKHNGLELIERLETDERYESYLKG